jgi:hypothetical protein
VQAAVAEVTTNGAVATSVAPRRNARAPSSSAKLLERNIRKCGGSELNNIGSPEKKDQLKENFSRSL